MIRFLRTLNLIACSAAVLSVMAAPLTPEQALGRAMSGSGTQMRAPAQAEMKLAYTVEGKTASTVYVFTPEAAGTTGFMVVSADDMTRPLLGYSDADNFDAANVPPQLLYWLDCYNASIQAVREGLRTPAQVGLAIRADQNGTPRRANRSAISPLCSTQWNQDAPYNNECPVVAGSRSVTGCVATAMAQVMKKHQWPVTGTDSYSYSWTYGGTSYSDSFNFGSTTFEWSQMLDSYTSSATPTQQSAVAKLMHACGVASEMSYSPNSSGTSNLYAARGLIDYLGYDAALYAAQRDWYTTSDWDALIYGEIAAGRPVLYCGNDGSSGHAFVCDGYQGNDYYHINWGWGGVADGYFLLADLNPYTQGIGGGSGQDGFNYGQSALIGVKKAESGSTRPLLVAASGKMETDATAYTRDSSTKVTLYGGASSSDGIYNYSTYKIGTIYFGWKLVSDTDTQIVPAVYCNDMDINYGLRGYSVVANRFPVGTWKAYPVVSEDGENWTRIKYDPTLSNGYFVLDVTDTAIVVSPGPIEDDSEEPDVEIEMVSATPDNDGIMYRGEIYNFSFSFKSTSSINETYYAVLTADTGAEFSSSVVTRTATGDSDADSPAIVSTPMVVSSETGSEVVKTCTISVPEDLDLDENLEYRLHICTFDGSVYHSLEYFAVHVEDAPFKLTIELTSVSPDDEVFYMGDTYRLEYKFSANREFSDTYYAVLVDYETSSVKAASDAMDVSSADGSDMYASCYLTIPEGLDTNTANKYVIYVCKVVDGYYEPLQVWEAPIAKKESGVGQTFDDEADATVYHDLQGHRVSSPQPGQVVIIHHPATPPTKVLY